MTVKILHAGLAIPQDDGRLGYAQVGVSRSGAFDHYSYRLLGNLMGYPSDYSYPAIELLAGTLSLRIEEDVIFAVIGNCRIDINGFPAPGQTVLEAKAGDHLYLQVSESGPAYLSFDGLGFPKVLDSVSFDSMSGIGNPQLKGGDTLAINNEAKVGAYPGQFALPLGYGYQAINGSLRIIAGPHDGVDIITNRTWRVASLSRSGIRLSLDPSEKPYTTEEVSLLEASSTLKSLPVMPGAIQLPVSGNPIILGPDSGVTGGYAVPGVVISADLSKLARLNPGGKINFKKVTEAEAIEAYSQELKALNTKVIRVNNMN